jgi:hypothetical protein
MSAAVEKLDAVIGALQELRAALVAPPPDPGPVYIDQDSCVPLSRRAFLEHARAGDYPTIKLGKRVCVRREDFAVWLESCRRTPKPPPPAYDSDPITSTIDLAVERMRRRGAR